MSKHCLRAVALSFAAAAPWLYAGPQNINPGGDGPEFRSPQPSFSDRGDCGSDTLTQSTSPNVIGAATVICGDAETSAEFSLARRFVAPSTMTVECVTFGVRLNVGPAWTAHVRLLVGDLLGPYDALTVLADEVVAIPADSDFDFYTVSMPGVVLPAGTEFMVELLSPSRFPADGGDGGLLGFGCNVQGQSAPTYYRGPACGDPDFIDLASIGFAGRHLVMTLGVEPVSPPDNDLPQDAPLVTLGGGAEFSTVGAGSDGPPNSCANEGDVWFMVQAGMQNTMTIGLLAYDSADMAIALYDIGPTGMFDPGDLGTLLVSCVDTATPGEESAVFDVTPGNFYLMQIGNGGGGGGGTGSVGMWDGSGLTPIEFSVLACVPWSGCVGMPFSQYFALSSLGVTLVNSCGDCQVDPPGPCLDNTAHLIAYWPMDVDPITNLFPSALDAIGSLDALLPCTFAGPGNCVPEYDPVVGLRGNAIALKANAVNGANTFPFTTSGVLPDVGKGSFTISAWVKRPTTGAAEVFRASGFPTGWSVSILADGKLQLDITSDNCPSGSPVNLTRTSTSAVATGTWQHIAVAVSKQSSGATCSSGGGVAFYINGQPAGVAGLGGLFYDCSAIQYFLGGPNVWIDEVMLFGAFVSAARIEEIYEKTMDGVCPFTIRQTPFVDCSIGAPELVICNVFGPDQNFGYTLAGIPSGSCVLGVSPSVGSVFVPSGSCVTIPITLTIPPGCVSNTASLQWIATVTDSATLTPKVALSTVRCEYLTFGGSGGSGVLGLRVGEGPSDLALELVNVSGAPLTASYALGVANPDGDPDDSMFSLNGLAPGQAITGVVNLPAGGTAMAPITVEALSVDALGVYELTLSVDPTGGANFEPSDAIGLQALPVSAAAPCPGDTNGDGVVDFADLNTVLSAFNTAAPGPGYNPAADFDGDGLVNFSDLNTLLGAFNTLCP